ncbi:MAG: polya polymerase [Eubacteriales bacterium]|nr:polya polymerase [Eubacteriales bacterium]
MKNRLKPDANIAELLKDAKKCKGEVTITTEDGDLLNLKSALSQYVLIVLAGQPEILNIASLNYDDEDAEKMKFYIA